MNVVMLGSFLMPLMENAASLLPERFKVDFLPSQPENDEQRRIFSEAEVIGGFSLEGGWPTPAELKMWQVFASGYERVDTRTFPSGTLLCNCSGHQIPVAEYVMQSILHWQRPLVDAFQRMKNNDWYYYSPAGFQELRETCGLTLGILGYGMIGKEVAKRARAFGMKVLACNRSPVDPGEDIDACYGLDQIAEFAAEVDFLSISLALAEATINLVDASLFTVMKTNVVIINVGRAGLIDEEAIFSALKEKRIRGAVLDPQYHYPSAENPNAKPTNLDFASLNNALLTSHMSGCSEQLIGRRAQFSAENILRIERGEIPQNIVWRAS